MDNDQNKLADQGETGGNGAGGSQSGLLEGLTDPQQRAVTTTEGPVLVIAAAGSGKTRVITRRAAYLTLELGIAPWQVLSITFTNKAAGEMRERVHGLMSTKQAQAMAIGTFHAQCVRLLREFHEAANLKSDFTIFDMNDQKRAIKQALNEMNISTGNFSPGGMLSSISNAKNQLIDAAAFEANAMDFYDKTVARVYKGYQTILTRSGGVDFDDLLMKMARLLQNDDAVREELQERYTYVQVDEYQDTNHAQFVIANALASGHKNLCVVGDPDQSIYGWRGANIKNIMEFEDNYPGAQVIELGQNYRSTPEILLAADTLIKNNSERRDKPLFTENPGGEKIQAVQLLDEEEEAEVVVEFLRDVKASGIEWGNMAVFYRVNALSRVMEDALLGSAIPYQVARGTAFYQRKEIKDAMGYLRLIANPDDEVNLLRVINTPTRGIGDTTIKKLQAWSIANGLTLWGGLNRAAEVESLNSRAVGSVGKFVAMIGGWRNRVAGEAGVLMDEMGGGLGIRQLVEMVIEGSGLEAFYRHEKTGDEEKLANVLELVTAASRFDSEYGEEDADAGRRLMDYLEFVTLASDVDAVDNEGGVVTLMTLHAAKGLEFEAVAMIGLEEGILPHSRSQDSPSEMEEERRLCFVGITRAEKRLMMLHARYRTLRGVRERTIPSPFLAEVGREAVVYEDRTGYSAAGSNSGSGFGGGGIGSGSGGYGRVPGRGVSGGVGDGLDDFEVDMDAHSGGLVVGVLVRHPQFGLGKVMSLVPRGAPTRGKVMFEEVGLKTLVLEYARLELVDMDDVF